MSVSFGDRAVGRSPKETDIEADVVDIRRSSWGWAQGCPKHL